MSHQSSSKKMLLCAAAAVTLVLLLGAVRQVQAGQGCPFDDGSCREYCSGQGCQMGYCGHFAWTQCICRKCGDEWNWYDKVRYNPNQAVNQTELDSLKLNTTRQQPVQQASNDKAVTVKPEVGRPQENKSKQQPQQSAATLTTLLIPDLSEGNNKLDLNDIPDENSDKFLDYLAKNHEKLVQASRQQQAHNSDDTDDDTEDATETTTAATTTAPTATQSDEILAEETVEIQISSSNNNRSSADESTSSAKDNGQQQQQQTRTRLQPQSHHSTIVSSPQMSPLTRMLKMAVVDGLELI